MEGSNSTWIAELGETTQPSIGDFIESVHGRDAKKIGRTILLGLLGPHLAGPADDDGWFAADYVMAHHIYGDIGGERTWLSSVDLVKEAEFGPYLWGYPKDSRIVIFSKDDEAFYTLCSPELLISTYKETLQRLVASMTMEDRLLLLIFAHGEHKGKTGILVGTDSSGDFGILRVEEMNGLLRPLLGLHPITLITSACYSGEWHDHIDQSRSTFAATGTAEESLSFPMSASGCCRGGYFWGGIWYELSRLGIPTVGKDVHEGGTFRAWTERVQQRVQDLMIFNPVPTRSVSHEDVLEKHAREVTCLHLDKVDFSFTSTCQQVPSNPDPDSIRDEDAALHHFTGGSVVSRSIAIPRFSEDLDTSCYPLDVMMDYFSRCNPGLPNSASCSQVYRLARLYTKGLGTKKDKKNLYDILMYRFQQDSNVGQILSFLKIPRVCHIFNFKQWERNIPGMVPYIDVVRIVYPFDDPPKLTPPCHRYTKPTVYLAWTAFTANVDVSWFKSNLLLYGARGQAEATRGETSEAGARTSRETTVS